MPKKSLGLKKKKVSSAKVKPKTLQAPLLIDPNDSKHVDVRNRDEQWSQYLLEDGNTIRLKPALLEIRKVKQAATNGDPIYIVKSTVITDALILKGK